KSVTQHCPVTLLRKGLQYTQTFCRILCSYRFACGLCRFTSLLHRSELRGCVPWEQPDAGQRPCCGLCHGRRRIEKHEIYVVEQPLQPFLQRQVLKGLG